MLYNRLDTEILNKLSVLNGSQKEDLLEYMAHMPRAIHSKKRYRRRAMKEIRAAISSQR